MDTSTKPIEVGISRIALIVNGQSHRLELDPRTSSTYLSQSNHPESAPRIFQW